MSAASRVVSDLPPSTVPTSSVLALPPRLFVPVGGNAKVLEVGTRVERGDRIVSDEASGALTPAPGTLVEVRDVELLDARRSRAVEIEVGTSAQTAEGATPSAKPQAADGALVDVLRRSGVTASRHTSPDLLAQLQEAKQTKIDLIVCNLLDVDGGSSLHAKVIRERGAMLVAGLSAIATAVSCKNVIIAADPSLSGRASVLARKSKNAAKIKVESLENDYPQSDPTLLLYALSGKRLLPGELPTSVGAIVLDGVAAAAIGRCIENGEPMLTVPIEIRDSTRARSHVAVAAVGTPLRFVLESLGMKGSYTLRAGAALRDVRVSPDAIVSGDGELSIDAGAISIAINPDPCIRSGWCVENCPVRINPAALLEAAQENDSAMAEKYGLHACIECGICSYVCPSRLPLLGAIRELRKGARS